MIRRLLNPWAEARALRREREDWRHLCFEHLELVTHLSDELYEIREARSEATRRGNLTRAAKRRALIAKTTESLANGAT